MGLSRNEKVMVIVLLAGTLLVVLNQTFLSPALPTIMADLAVDATTVQWLTSGYALVEAVVIPLNAFLVGRFSTRRLFMGGLSMFALGSLVAAAAPAFPVLLLGRVMQACGTGVVMPMVFTLIILLFPRERRGSAMGIVGLVISFAPAVGPSISGILIDSVGWRALFVIVVVLAIAVVIVAGFFLENRKGFERASFDVPSVILLACGMVGLLYGLSTFASGNPVVSALLMIVGLALLGVFARRQLALESPMLRVGVLKTREYRIGVIAVALLQAAVFGGCSVVVPLYIQGVLGESATVSGLVMLPGAAIGAGMSVVAGRLFDNYGARAIALSGGAVAALAACGLAACGIDTSIIIVAVPYTLMVIGVQCENPVAFLAAGVLTSLAYMNIIFMLGITLRHIGKAAAVILLIMQIPGSSGMYPIEMMPGFFRMVHPLLPFTYGIDAMRQAMAGIYGHDLAFDAAILLSIVLVSLFIGLVVRPYVLNLNVLFDAKLHETGFLVSEEQGMRQSLPCPQCHPGPAGYRYVPCDAARSRRAVQPQLRRHRARRVVCRRRAAARAHGAGLVRQCGRGRQAHAACRHDRPRHSRRRVPHRRRISA